MTTYKDLVARSITQDSINTRASADNPLVGGFTGESPSPLLNQFTPKEEEYGKLEVLKAAFETENTIGSSISELMAGNFNDQEEKPDYDVVSKIKDTDLEPYLDSFVDVYNDQQFENMKSQIGREKTNRSILDSSGGFGLASVMAAGSLDLVNLIPIGGTAYRAIKTGNVIKGALRTGQAAGLSEIAVESVLQSQQEMRTFEESAINIAATTVLGGALGATAAKLSKTDFSKLAKRTQEQQQVEDLPIRIDNDGNLSAARVPETTLDQETLAGGRITNAVIKSTKKLNPMLTVLDSSSKKAREILQKTVRTNMFFNKNTQGIASQQSVEINIRRHDAGLGKSLQNNRDLFKQLNSKDLTSKLKAKAGLGYREFNDQVSLAMIRGDIHEVPEIQQAAQTWRKEVFDPLKNEAIEQGLLPKDVNIKTATSYLMRQYNTNKIIAQEGEFKELVRLNANQNLLPDLFKKAESKQNLNTKQITKLEDELSGIKGKISKAKEDELIKLQDRQWELRLILDDTGLAAREYADEIADSVFDSIRGIETKGVSMPYDIKMGVRGPAKERVLNFIRDEDLRPYLETDINTLGQNYTRVLGTDVELKRAFGSLNLKDEFTEMKVEYDKLRKDAKTEKEKTKLNKEEVKVKEILNAFVDIMRGNYGRVDNPDSFWPKAARISRSVQYMSKLGGVALSSIPDTARHLMIHGYGRVFGKGVKALITNSKALKLTRADAKQAGQLYEAVTHQRSALMGDINNPYSTNSTFETLTSHLAQNFSRLTGLNVWNNYQKGFAFLNTQQRIIENIKGWKNTKDRRYMAFLGIDDNNQASILKQLKKHGTQEDGVEIANIKNWTNPEAARIYKNALNTDVDRTIVTKGVGDIPLLMNKELVKTALQFRSFAFAAHQQVLIAGMQQADAAFLSGSATMIGMGMMTYYLKSIASGREISNDPNVWLAEGIDRSGIMPILMEMNGLADTLGAGVGSQLGAKPLSRYASRNKIGSFMGPSFGSAQDAFQVGVAIARGDFNERDIRAIRKNLPLQNLFYIRGVIDNMEESIAN